MKVSVIIPTRNEEAFIRPCLDSILANDYPKDRLEVLVVDGMSDDGTRSIVQGYGERYSFIRLVENSKQITACAFNTGIRLSSGSLIMIMGAHAVYSPEYISRSVAALDRYGADNVGGVIRTLPRDSSLLARSLAFSLSHRFGVGNSHFRCANESPRWVDTVFGGCYSRDVFARIGLFNEQLIYNQDLEFNLRLRRAGGKILLDPGIVSYYYARSDLRSFCKHSFRDGGSVISSLLYSRGLPLSWRHVAPLAALAGLASLGALSFVNTPCFWALVTLLLGYVAANLYASATIARRERDLRLLATMPFAFGLLHGTYAAGALGALARIPFGKAFWRKLGSLAGRRRFASSSELEECPVVGSTEAD